MVELLAPGGSITGIKAALYAGADAVYTGGPLFGARAYADNPEIKQLLDMIDYCHLRNKKLYLTVNTLLKETELKQSLYAYLEPLYRQGLDAVLVQDPGVLRFLKAEFPELPLHASTQMSIHSVSGARLMKKLGFARIVPARELTLSEIRSIREQVDIEIECFVHGALCYCYSGRCLMSSMIGGRSGNRGRCAQPCRLPYTVSGKTIYALSLKDICTLSLLPDLIEAGIASFKIEGRMKRAEYAAGVSEIYRKYIDLYLSSGRKGYRIDPEDERALMDLYNRGGFSTGYYTQPKGPGMMAFDRPNHAGTEAAIVQKQPKGKKGNIQLKALEPLNKGDVLELIPGENKLQKTLPYDIPKGKTFELPVSAPIANQATVLRVSNEALLTRLAEQYCLKDQPIPTSMRLTFLQGQPIQLEAKTATEHITIKGQIPQSARSAPLTETDLRKAIQKTGGDGHTCTSLDIHMDTGLFLPISALNALRRETLAALREKTTKKHRRNLTGKNLTGDGSLSASSDPISGPEGVRKDLTGDGSLSASPTPVSEPEMAQNKGKCLTEPHILSEENKENTLSERVFLLGKNLTENRPLSETGSALSGSERPFLPEKNLTENRPLSGILSGFQVVVSDLVQLKVAVSCDWVDEVLFDSSWLLDMQVQGGLDVALWAAFEGCLREAERKHVAVGLLLPFVWRDAVRERFFSVFSGSRLDAFSCFSLRCLDQLEDFAALGRELIAEDDLYCWNSSAVCMLDELGFSRRVAPAELTFQDLKDRGVGRADILPVYGYHPLMISSSCLQKNTDRCTGKPGVLYMKDRTGRMIRVVNHCGLCTNVLYNPDVLDLSRQRTRIDVLSPGMLRAHFTSEDQKTMEDVMQRLHAWRFAGDDAAFSPDSTGTSGHFRRGVE